MRRTGLFAILKANLLRRKGSALLNVLVLTLCYAVILLSVCYSYSMNQYITGSLEQDVDYRMVTFSTYLSPWGLEEAQEKVSAMEHVTAVFPQSARCFYGESKDTLLNQQGADGDMRIKGGNAATFPKVTQGRAPEDGERGVMIVPEKFFPYSGIESIYDVDQTGYLHGEDLLGQTITVSYHIGDFSNEDEWRFEEGGTKSFQVIGVYDSESTRDFSSVCYASYDDVEELNTLELGNYEEYYPKDYIVLAVVDRYDQMNSVMAELSSMGLTPNRIGVMDELLANMILAVCWIAAIVALGVSVGNLFLSTRQSLAKRTAELGLMKAIGYTNRNLLVLVLAETLLLSVLAMGISLIPSFWFADEFNGYMMETYDRFNCALIEFGFLGILLLILLAVAVPVISCLGSIRRVRKIAPSVLTKEG